MSSRAELVAAALERWETFKSDWPHTKPGDNAFDIGDALARLLRESQPEPAPVVEMPDKFAAFGRMVWDVITQRMSTAMMDETDADNAELAVKAGLADHVRYDPEKHGHVEDAEPGDKIVWWGAR